MNDKKIKGIAVSVIDEAIGIPEDEISSVFKKFKRSKVCPANKLRSNQGHQTKI